jgi:hypothetical protein
MSGTWESSAGLEQSSAGLPGLRFWGAWDEVVSARIFSEHLPSSIIGSACAIR